MDKRIAPGFEMIDRNQNCCPFCADTRYIVDEDGHQWPCYCLSDAILVEELPKAVETIDRGYAFFSGLMYLFAFEYLFILSLFIFIALVGG